MNYAAGAYGGKPLPDEQVSHGSNSLIIGTQPIFSPQHNPKELSLVHLVGEFTPPENGARASANKYGRGADKLAHRSHADTVRVAAAASRLEEYPLNIAEGSAHVQAVSHALSTFGRQGREAIDQVEKLGDIDAADIFTEISRGINKWLVCGSTRPGRAVIFAQCVVVH